MLEVEVIGSSDLPEESLRRLVAIALASAGVDDGHVAVEFVDSERIAALNAEHRGIEGPTDVLSFPVDLDGPEVGPRELGRHIREVGAHPFSSARRSSRSLRSF